MRLPAGVRRSTGPDGAGPTFVEILCIIATAAALVPVWLFRWFPTQDGPSHLYNAYVLAHYHDAASSLLRSYFDVNLRLFPNWTTYAVMALLLRLFSPLVVQQIILSICIISVPAAVLYLQKSFKPAADPAALLGIPLAFSFVLFMGFFNFIVGAALFAVATGFWWRRRNGRYLYGLYGLLLAIYLSHDLAFVAALLAIAILAAVERRRRVFIELAPAFLVFVVDAATRPHAGVIFQSFRWHLGHLPALFVSDHIAITAVLMLIVTVGIVFAFVRSRPNALAAVSAVIFVVYFIAPWGYHAGGWVAAGWISERLLFLTLLTLPAWIALPRPAVAMTVLLVAIAAHLVTMSLQFAMLNDYIRTITACSNLIRPHSTFRTFFPKAYVSPQVTPTLHVASYLGLQADVVDLDNYEGYLPDFPIAYRQQLPSRPPDYVVIWRATKMGPVAGYRLLFENDAIRLYHAP